MARSSLLGIDTAAPVTPGRDTASLGPGDNSDSGSDMAGLDSEDDDADPGLPVDVALRDDQQAPLPLGESLPASDGGTGVRDGADIGVDQVFSAAGPLEDEELVAPDAAEAAVEDDEDEDGEEGEGEDVEGLARPGGEGVADLDGTLDRQPRRR